MAPIFLGGGGERAPEILFNFYRGKLKVKGLTLMRWITHFLVYFYKGIVLPNHLLPSISKLEKIIERLTK